FRLSSARAKRLRRSFGIFIFLAMPTLRLKDYQLTESLHNAPQYNPSQKSDPCGWSYPLPYTQPVNTFPRPRIYFSPRNKSDLFCIARNTEGWCHASQRSTAHGAG